MQAATMQQRTALSHRVVFRSGQVKQTPQLCKSARTARPLAQAAPDQAQCYTSRRDVLLSSSMLATYLLVGNTGPAHAGLDRYVKKKKLDPLDTYVPLVLEAREVLGELDAVMVQDPSAARQALRSGPFGAMRDNIRALGQYAAQPTAEGGAGLSESDATQLVQAFFRALEDFDLLLYNAVREYKQQVQKANKDRDSSSDDEDAAPAGDAVEPAVGLDKALAGEKLQVAVQKLDALIATVPADVMAKSQQVLAKVRGMAVAEAS